MSAAGLSYDQAPPFGLPLRFFLAAPLFLLLAALAGLAGVQDWSASRWSPAALALTHVLALGYLGMVMLGALLQMLPVVLGTPVPAVRTVAWAGWLGLAVGTPLLALGLWQGEPVLLVAAMTVLTAGLLPWLLGVAASLSRFRGPPATGWPMRQAWLALVLTLAFGLRLAGGLAGLWPLPDPQPFTAMHLTWGLGGWVMILIMGVAYQVVPMLQLTPAYPAVPARWLTWLALAGLLGYTLATLFALEWAWLMALPTLVAAVAFGLVTLDLQRRRRRKLGDVTLDFWRLGMVSLMLCALTLPWLAWLPEAAQTSLGLTFLLGFAAAVVNGMLYKIVPFLAWFHLQAQTGARAGAIPNMKQFLPEAAARRHLRLHLAAVLLLLPAPWLPPLLATPGLILLAASAQVLWLNLIGVRRLFLSYGGRL